MSSYDEKDLYLKGFRDNRMKDMKIYLPEELEKRFKKMSMDAYGYGRGSISKAAAEAIRRWTVEHEEILREFEIPADPIGAIKGMLKHVRKTGVELQHEASKIRAERAMGAS
jgi:hypothetical protein